MAQALVACIATRPPTIDERPRWRVQAPSRLEASCVDGNAFVRKSGKQGFGVALQLKSRSDCKISVDSAVLRFARGRTVTVPTIAPIELPGRSLAYAWLPVPFDNDAAWDAERNDATLVLGVTIAGAATQWLIAVHQQ